MASETEGSVGLEPESLYPISRNGIEIGHLYGDFDDITFLVSNCSDKNTAVLRVSDFMRMLAGKAPRKTATCETCGKPIHGRSDKSRCGDACRTKAYRDRKKAVANA